MARLKLCIMVHIEDSEAYEQGRAAQYALLGTRVARAGGGARMSWQFDSTYFDIALGYPPTGDTSLTYLLTNTHNFWVQNHCATYSHLTTTWARVSSAFERERGAVPADANHVLGRSGGADVGNAVDWVSISVARGLKALNAATQRNYDYTPTSFRPMGYTDAEIMALHGHERAPGSTNYASGVSLWPNQRPIWMDTASRWDLKANTVNAVYSGSIVTFPSPSNDSLERLSAGRSATSGAQDLATTDLNLALSQIWSTYQNATMMNSVTNLWYIMLPPAYCLTPYHDRIVNWVSSINGIMGIGGGSPLGEWRNMNEITSLAYDATSRYY